MVKVVYDGTIHKAGFGDNLKPVWLFEGIRNDYQVAYLNISDLINHANTNDTNTFQDHQDVVLSMEVKTHGKSKA